MMPNSIAPPRLPLLVALFALLSACVAVSAPQPDPAARAPAAGPAEHGWAVSAADPRAEEAGRAILAQGGSATDAAIAVMLALTVVEPQSSGIGGGGFLVRAGENGRIKTYDGRETAPLAATPRRFLDDEGRVLPPEIRVTSGLSVGVPGNIALAALAHRKHGKLPWRKLFEPAIRLAREGFRMNRRLHQSLQEQIARAARSEAARALYLDADGAPLAVGARVQNEPLARTLEQIAELGPDHFYREMGKEMAAYIAAETPRDGAMTHADFLAYRAKTREAVCAPYRAYRICGMGPPTSGGIAVLQMLGQLERFDLAALGPRSPRFWHLFLESQRLAYADREVYLADPDFVEVPVDGLIARDYIAARSALIREDGTLDKAEPGVPAGAKETLGSGLEPEEQGTSHFSIVDGAGHAVSYTSTIEGPFGSGLLHEGFYLNNELTDFSLLPERDGKPVANRVEGGKRPRSSMAPTVVYDAKGRILLVIGAAGGSTIPVQVARSLIGVLDFGLSAGEAIALPFTIAYADTVFIEEGSTLESLRGELEALGHRDIRSRSFSLKTNALLRKQNGWEAAGDPRIAPLLLFD